MIKDNIYLLLLQRFPEQRWSFLKRYYNEIHVY